MRRRGVALDRRTQLLYDDRHFYINGAASTPPGAMRSELAELADRRALTAAQCHRLAASTIAQLHEWYKDGYLDIES